MTYFCGRHASFSSSTARGLIINCMNLYQLNLYKGSGIVGSITRSFKLKAPLILAFSHMNYTVTASQKFIDPAKWMF